MTGADAAAAPTATPDDADADAAHHPPPSSSPLEQRLALLEADLATAQAGRQHAESESTALRARLHDTDGALRAVQEHVVRLRSALAACEAQRDEARVALHRMEQRNGELREEKELNRRGHDELVKQLHGQLLSAQAAADGAAQQKVRVTHGRRCECNNRRRPPRSHRQTSMAPPR